MQIKLNSQIYCTEAIINACYAFLERAYVFLDKAHKGSIVNVTLKPKKELSSKQTRALRGDFMNELLHSALRYQISKNNKKIREYIIGRALYNTAPSVPVNRPENDQLDYLKDPLQIAIPWEKKYGKKKKSMPKAG